MELLGKVTRTLGKRGVPSHTFIEIALIDAMVPIVHARHRITNLVVQIQSTTNGYAGMEMVKSYLAEFPTLRPLFFVLRQLLTMRGLGESRAGGIGSYTLVMMIVAALKFSTIRFEHHDAGRHLLYFLDFYSRMNFSVNGISVDPPELFLKSMIFADKPEIPTRSSPDEPILSAAVLDHAETIRDGRRCMAAQPSPRPYMMYLQDPANAYNNLGKQVLGIKHVQATFASLRAEMQECVDYAEMRVRDQSFSVLEPCLAGNYRTFEAERKALLGSMAQSTKEPVIAR